MDERQEKPVMERYLEWAATHQAKPIANRAEFIKVKSEVETMLENGVSVRGIWGFFTAEGRITYGLSSFTRDVRKLIAKTDKAPSPRPVAPAPLAAPVVPAPPPVAPPPAATGGTVTTPSVRSRPPPTVPTPTRKPDPDKAKTFSITKHPNPKDFLGE